MRTERTTAAQDARAVAATRAAAVLWLGAAAVHLAGEALAAAALPGYSYAADYVSELGVPDTGPPPPAGAGSPLHHVMNAAFVAHGALFLAAALLAAALLAARVRRHRAFVALAAVHCAGLVLVAVFPSGTADPGDPLAAAHGLGAAMAIGGGNLALIAAGLALRPAGALRGLASASAVLGVAGLVAAAILVAETTAPSLDLLPNGLWERVAVYPITAWEVVAGTTVLVRGRHAAGRRPG